jgi:hypothetical protein
MDKLSAANLQGPGMLGHDPVYTAVLMDGSVARVLHDALHAPGFWVHEWLQRPAGHHTESGYLTFDEIDVLSHNGLVAWEAKSNG